MPASSSWEHCESGADLYVQLLFKRLTNHRSVCVASIVRIVEVSAAAPQDVTYAQAGASVWTAIEQQVGVLSANLPTLAPLFEQYFGKRNNSSQEYGSNANRARPVGPSRGPLSANRQRSQLSRSHIDGFERISDELETKSKNDSMRDLELGDRTILVKTDFTAVESREVTKEVPKDIEMNSMKTSWLRK